MPFPTTPRAALSAALEAALSTALGEVGTLADASRKHAPALAPTVAVEEFDSLFTVQTAHTRYERIQWRVLVKVGGTDRDALGTELTNAKHWLINTLDTLFKTGIPFTYNGAQYQAFYGAEITQASVMQNINQDNAGIGAASAQFAWGDGGLLHRIG